MTEKYERCSKIETVWGNRCTKIAIHVRADTADERLCEFMIKPGDTLRWGSRADMREVFPMRETDPDD